VWGETLDLLDRPDVHGGGEVVHGVVVIICVGDGLVERAKQGILTLAQLISKLPLQGLRLLELRCGLGIASLVASSRGGDITASDHHPLAESFMSQNVALNELPGVKFAHGDWCTPITQLGKFNLIIGSYLLYERDQPALPSVFIDCHATSDAKIILCDPGRREAKRFNRLMVERGFSNQTEYLPVQMLMS